MQEFDVYASWMIQAEKIGHCVVENARGKEIIGFSYEREWLRRHPGFVLDPDILQMEGIQFPPANKPCCCRETNKIKNLRIVGGFLLIL